jgi:NAD(P)H-hydrate epimerase
MKVWDSQLILKKKKILTINQLREADQYTIQNEPIVSIDLIERISAAC